MIRQDHVPKGPCYCKDRKLLRYITTLPNLVAIDIVAIDTKFLVRHVISQNLVIKGLCDVMGRSPSG